MILVLQFTPRVNYLASQYVDWILQNEHVKTSTSVHFCLVCKLVRTFWICGRIFLMWPVKWNLCTSTPLVFCCLLSFYNLKSWFWARVDTKYLASQSYCKAGQTGFLVLTQRQQICDIRRFTTNLLEKTIALRNAKRYRCCKLLRVVICVRWCFIRRFNSGWLKSRVDAN